MAVLSTIYRAGLWMGLPAVAVSIYLLAQCIAGVIRTGRQSRLVSVPLVALQDVRLPEAGPVVLELEGPIFTRPFAGLAFRLVGPDGADVRSRSALFHATTTGVTRARMELRVFEIAVPGRHVLRIEGMTGERKHDAECRLLFKRPHLGRSVAWVVGIVLSSGLAIGSLVLFLLRLVEATRGSGTPAG